MKNIALICLFGFSLSAITACSSNNGTANAESKKTPTESQTVVVESKFHIENLEKTEYIAETKNSYIGRYVDCSAGVTIYTHGTAISIMPNAQISQKLIKEKCKF